MSKGKQTCKILRDIRRQIAEVNDIEYITSECRYKGDCLGTCPKCEAEVRYLEQALERRRLAGKVVSVLGISAGLMTLPQIVCGMDKDMAMPQETVCQYSEVYQNADTVIVKGKVVDGTGVPFPGVTIMEKGTNNGVCSDVNGCFMLRVSGKLPLLFSFIGCETKEVIIPKGGASDLQVVLKEECILMGEVPVTAIEGLHHIEGVITDNKGVPLQDVAISRRWQGKDYTVYESDSEGKFRASFRKKAYFWFSKEGYQTQVVKINKRNTSEVRIVMKKVK